MENVAWAILIVWVFFLAIGHVWKESLYSIAGGVLGLVLMYEILSDSFVFAIALLLINAYVIWTALTSEL